MSSEVNYQRQIAAPPERVFDTFTSPEGQSELYGRDEPGWIVESECDLRVGGAWSVRFGPSADELYRHDYVFEAIEPPGRVLATVTETRLDGWSFDLTVEWTFESHEGGTLMTMLQSGFPTEELRHEHTLGVPHAFDRLERVIVAP